jgi:hypothetical protein
MFTDIRRMQEEIRQLRLRKCGDGPPGPWMPFGYYLPPHWKGTKNIPGLAFGDDTTYVDLTASDYTPRFYLDRDRVWLGGCVEFDIDRLGEANTYGAPGDTFDSTGGQYEFFSFLPARYAAAREQHFWLREDLDLSETGWLGSEVLIGTQGIDDPRGFGTVLDLTFDGDVHSEPSGDPLLQGTVVCLDGISWRVSA